MDSAKSRVEYELLNVIGKGTYGVVYKAVNKKTGEIVAVKNEKDESSISTKREIGILMSLPRHPSIVELKEVIAHNGVFLVMEYLPMDLGRYMHLQRSLTMFQVKRMTRLILEGIHFLHLNQVMHRDLKPSNILINDKAQPKICDFGLSRHVSSRSGSYTPGRRVCTLWYQAPELLWDSTSYSPAIDLWSVGCILAEMLTMEVLFHGNSEIHQLYCISRIIQVPVALRLKVGPSLSTSGFNLLQRLLAYEPTERITAEDALSHDWFKEL